MPHKFGMNYPPSVKHISRKAFFKHALSYIGLYTSNMRVSTLCRFRFYLTFVNPIRIAGSDSRPAAAYTILTMPI